MVAASKLLSGKGRSNASPWTQLTSGTGCHLQSCGGKYFPQATDQRLPTHEPLGILAEDTADQGFRPSFSGCTHKDT